MNNVRAFAPHLRAVTVPEELRGIPGWLMWHFQQFAGEKKPRKVPVYADGVRRHGTQGSEQDRNRLTTFVVARDAAIRGGFEGVGFAPLPEFGYTFLDFDNCVDAAGHTVPEVERITNRTYSEYSPSGKGIRAALKGDLGNHKTYATSEQYGFETFSSSGFVTFTGHILPNCDLLGYENRVADVDDFTRDMCARRFGQTSARPVDPDDFMAGHEARLNLTPERMLELLGVLDPSMGREPWLRVGMALHHECDGDDTGFDLWDDWSSGGDTYPGREGLRHQWDSIKGGAGRRRVTMASVIKMAKDAGYDYAPTPPREAALSKAEVIRADLPKKSGGRFGPVPIYDVTLAAPMPWLIKGVLPHGELGVLFGASGSGKSFVAMDMLFSVALGRDWRGHRVQRGRVVLIAAEGGAGIGKRAEAWAQYHGVDLSTVRDFHVITAAPNFLGDDDISHVIAEIQHLGEVVLICTDTLAQVSPGANENTSEDMSRVLSNLNLLREATGAMNLVVHHAGKDLSRGSRGWSGIKGAADVQIEIQRHDGGLREIILEKMKDGEDGVRWPFKLAVVEVGIDGDSDIITSCVAIEAEVAAAKDAEISTKGLKRRSRLENHVLEIMTLFGSESIVSANDLIQRAVEAMPALEEGERDTRRQRITRVVQDLSREKDGPMRLSGGRIIFYE